jgi:hypothetical protein
VARAASFKEPCAPGFDGLGLTIEGILGFLGGDRSRSGNT